MAFVVEVVVTDGLVLGVLAGVVVDLSGDSARLATVLTWLWVTAPLWLAIAYRLTLWRVSPDTAWVRWTARGVFGISVYPLVTVMAHLPSRYSDDNAALVYRLREAVEELASPISDGSWAGVLGLVFGGVLVGVRQLFPATVHGERIATTLEQVQEERQHQAAVAAVLAFGPVLALVIGLLISV